MSRGRPFAYLPYQLGDYLLQRAALPLIMILLTVGLPLYGMKTTPGFWETSQGADFARQLFKSTVTLFLPVGAFLAVSNVISKDRQQGYTRFYFSKPVNAIGYYAQTFLLHGLVYVALFGLITFVFGRLTSPIPVPGAIAAAALTFVLVGSLGFMLGALTRFDGGILAVIYLLASLTQQLVAQATESGPGTLEALPRFVRPLATILPPVHAMSAQRELLFLGGQALDMSSVAHILGYSAGAVALGVIFLRRLPLAR